MLGRLRSFAGGLHAKSIAYATTTLGAYLIHSVVMFYYVKIYLSRFHVTQQWFQTAQVIFMIWNAINDPLFGCLQDNARCVGGALSSRRHSILYGAPLFVLSFYIFWFPWTDYAGESTAWVAGIQLTVALCLYDALFTFVLLAQCALLTELSTDQTDRVRLIRYAQAAGLVGSTSVFLCEWVSDGLREYGQFQLTCIVLGLAAGACFIYTGLKAQTPYDRQRLAESVDAKTASDDHPAGKSVEPRTTPAATVAGVLRQTRQIFKQPSFVSFVLMNLCQIYHTTYVNNFANIVGERLLKAGSGQIWSTSVTSLFYGSLVVGPQLLVIVGAPLVNSYGYYRLIRASFVLKITTGLLFYVVGYSSAWFVAVFFLVDSANAGATFSLFGLCLSDVIDVDREQHKRSHPLSSMVFGLNALVTKPSISLAPMITVAILSRYGYSSATPLPTSSPGTTFVHHTTPAGISPGSENLQLTEAMFYTTCIVPVVIGLTQLVLWRFYTIRDSHKPGYQLVLQPPM